MKEKLVAFLVDDDPVDLQFFQIAAARISEHVDCKFADSAADALAMLNDVHFNPDFIFLDINMSPMHGLECLRLVRTIKRLDNVPVYMYSTSYSEDITKASLLLGATSVIQKVPSIRLLKELLSEIFQKQIHSS